MLVQLNWNCGNTLLGHVLCISISVSLYVTPTDLYCALWFICLLLQCRWRVHLVSTDDVISLSRNIWIFIIYLVQINHVYHHFCLGDELFNIMLAKDWCHIARLLYNKFMYVVITLHYGLSFKIYNHKSDLPIFYILI